MDYTQDNKRNKNPDFFTVGAGTNNPEINIFEAENNLDLSNRQTTWQSASPENRQEIGNKVVGISSEQNIPPVSPENPPEFGQVIELFPPKIQSPESITAYDNSPYNKKVIKTKDRLNKEGIQELDRVVKEFEKNGNTADFYDIARDMAETHLDNSYNRILGKSATKNINEPHSGGMAA